jgi:hypothetical protein
VISSTTGSRDTIKIRSGDVRLKDNQMKINLNDVNAYVPYVIEKEISLLDGRGNRTRKSARVENFIEPKVCGNSTLYAPSARISRFLKTTSPPTKQTIFWLAML